jgi:hypothetical protein
VYQSRLFALSASLLAIGLLAGCATNRSEIKLSAPATAVASTTAPSKGVVYLRSVSDARVFEEKPSDPSHPSLGFGGAAAATDDVKARAIGRKRNGFGQAIGDVLLENGQTVVGVVRDNLSAAFQAAGYQVVTTEPAAGAATLVADVKVTEFWAWLRPGFWALTLTTNITTDVRFAGATAPLTVSAHAEDSRQAATEKAWMAIVDKALVDFRNKAATAAAALR